MNTSRPMVPPCLPTPARWGWRGSSRSVRTRPIAQAARGLAQIEESGLRSGEAGGGGRLGAMTHREYLAQADRLIAECKDRIARQREIIASAYENGHPTVLPVSLLRVLEENLRSFEKYRLLILDQIKKAQAQQQ